MKKVVKRNGQIVEFDEQKIANAVSKVFKEIYGVDKEENVKRVTESVKEKMFKTEKEKYDVEEIQDLVEKTLMELGEFECAKAYIIYREKKSERRKNPWNDIDERQEIILSKYLDKGETIKDFLNRVSMGRYDLFKALIDREFIFAGRILSAYGLPYKQSGSNCYVLPDPEDSIKSIWELDYRLAQTYAYGGGGGANLSKLRPKGAKVNNAARSTTGVVSFANMFSNTTLLIGQKNRRGALMLMLNDSHPELIDWIKAKFDLNAINGANLSVYVSNEFMDAAIEGRMWKLYFETPHEKIERWVNADDVLTLLAFANWDNGEPGIFFGDRANSYHLLSEYDDIKFTATNPCLRGDMKILTKDGYVNIEKLDGKEVELINKDGNVVKGKVWKTGKKEVYKIYRGANMPDIYATEEHRFMTNDGEEVAVKDLKGKRLMPYLNQNKDLDLKFVKYGFIFGDGYIMRLASKTHNGLEVYFGKNDKDVLKLFESDDIKKGQKYYQYYLKGYNEELRKIGMLPRKTYNKVLPTTIKNWTEKEKRSFLKGLYSANGTVLKSGRISYKTSSYELAHELVELLNELGFDKVYITTNKPRRFKNGKYISKASYDVNINSYVLKQKFYNEIGFIQKYKNERLRKFLIENSPIVQNVVATGEVVDVYDFNEPLTHWGVVEGVITHNCGEQPLLPWGSCNLGSINVSAFVKNPFTEYSYFDFDRFVNIVHLGVEALDDMLTYFMGRHPFEEQNEHVKKYREIGLGVMGFADLAVKMGIAYASDEFMELTEKIMHTMANEAAKKSALLAKEKGMFPACDKEKILASEFAQNVYTEEVKDLIKKYGLRNSRLISIAPTGSISNLLGVSGGTEPYYSIKYVRTVQSVGNDEEPIQVVVYEKTIKELMKVLGIKKEEDLPDYAKVTAMNIDPIRRVRFQGLLQKYVDTAISSTVNLPITATVEDIKNIYIEAYKQGLKGITTFRNGCRRVGILATEEEKEKAPKVTIDFLRTIPFITDKDIKTILSINDDELRKMKNKNNSCPECGAILIKRNGCEECSNCSFSKCSI